MGKGNIVVEVPETCYECELVDDFGFCRWINKYIDHYDICKHQRHPVCPIIPIKRLTPEKLYMESDGYADGNSVWDYYCPNCNYDFEEDRFNYCPECGQAIDWSEVENGTD